MDISFANIADTFVNQTYLEVVFAHFRKGILDSLRRALHITLEDNIQLFDLALLHLHVERVQVDLSEGHSLFAPLLGLLRCTMLGGTFISYYLQTITCLWHFRQSCNTYRCAGWRFLYTLATVIEHGTHFPRQGSHHDAVT